MDYLDGTSYVGNWVQNRRHGKGWSFKAQDGSISDLGDLYLGEWRNDSIHGLGTMIRTDGSVFRGYFDNDKVQL